jgi:hypothetical protein
MKRRRTEKRAVRIGPETKTVAYEPMAEKRILGRMMKSALR